MIRKAKSEGKGLHAVQRSLVRASAVLTEHVERLKLVESDLAAAGPQCCRHGSIDTLRTTTAPDVSARKAQIVLAEQ